LPPELPSFRLRNGGTLGSVSLGTRYRAPPDELVHHPGQPVDLVGHEQQDGPDPFRGVVGPAEVGHDLTGQYTG
jgi:hypothetical protein